MKNYFKIPNVSYRVWKVWLRNKDAFMKTAKANFIVPFLEPILYLLAFGFGLGFYIGEINGVSYPVFIAPALICISIMNSAFFECTYGSFVRMYYQKTFDAIIATPLNIDEVIFGEILWGSTKSVINASMMLLVVSIFRLVKLPDSILIIPLAFIVGFTFSTIAMCFTAISPTIDSFNYPTFLFITPMVFLSGTFFPLSILPKLIQFISFAIFPLTHALYISRELTTGALEPRSILSLIWLTTVGAILLILSINLMRKRLIV
ncbi:ABC transporter permease [Candidatus Bathyarchaeota archaeon]|nr:ABC transporter permease [Candidatus Bathyarchaeota archaeon]